MSFHDGLADCEPETGAAGSARTRRVGAVKSFKNVGALSGSDSRSAVFDREACMAVLKGPESYRSIFRRKVNGIREQIRDHLFKTCGIATAARRLKIEVES